MEQPLVEGKFVTALLGEKDLYPSWNCGLHDPLLSCSRRAKKGNSQRNWLYQTPVDILIKASNGASDFGNKFGQPLIAGSVLTFEHKEQNMRLGYDKGYVSRRNWFWKKGTGPKRNA